MKKTIYILLAVLFIVGCSKDEPINKITLEYQKLEEYKLLNKFDIVDGVSVLELNDSIISFSGKLKGSSKIGLIIFNSKTKENIVDIVPFENDQLVIEEPYEGKKTVTISHSICSKLVQNGNTIVIHIETPAYIKTSPTETISSTSYTSYHYIFIRNNRIIKSIYMNTNCSNQKILLNWKQNFILNNCDGTYLYTPLGEIITDIKYYYIENLSQYEVLNDFEGIFVDKYHRNIKVEKFDLRKENSIWESTIDLSSLNNPRLDETKLISKTDTHFTYELSYTEYSGTKGTIKFKVNIETGKIEYL